MNLLLVRLWLMTRFTLSAALPIARYLLEAGADGRITRDEAMGLVDILWPVDEAGQPKVFKVPFIAK
jgi:hypothetical protein